MSSDKIVLEFKINGRPCSAEIWPMSRLIDVIRDEERLTGTKEGCGEGECGACSVLLNGELVNSCLVPAIQAHGAEITTVEGILRDTSMDRLQDAFVESGGVQCGICTPGMLIATVYLLKRHPQPTSEQVREALAGNLCRCTGYQKIFDSITAACRKTGVLP